MEGSQGVGMAWGIGLSKDAGATAAPRLFCLREGGLIAANALAPGSISV